MGKISVNEPTVATRPSQEADRDNLARLCGILEVCDGEGMAASLPFGHGDTTAGAENELQTVVTGPRDQVDLARSVAESNYFKNLMRRAAAGEASKSLVRDIEDFLSDNPESTWENSWVYFLADAISFGREPHPVVRETGERLMRHFLNDNTSPETFSFHTVGSAAEPGLGRALGEETLRRFLLVQFLTMYANEKFELRARGQETLVCLAPHTPMRQKQLNELVADSFYRDLFMSPCLSGWDRGEEKYHCRI
ncbi:MAG: hypothetical protein WCL49_03410 [bacterium]